MDRWWLNLLLIPTQRVRREARLVSSRNWFFSLGLGVLQGSASAVSCFLSFGNIIFKRILQGGEL